MSSSPNSKIITLADGVLTQITLKLLAVLLNVKEPGLSHPPDRLNAPGDQDPDLGNEFFSRLAAMPEKHLRHGAGEIETLAERPVPQCLDLVHACGALFK